MDSLKQLKLQFETLLVHAGQEMADPSTGARAVPIYQTAAYVFESSQNAADRFALKAPGNIYGRLTNPTQEAFEQRMAAIEGGTACVALASGAAAVTYALENVLQPGDHIVAADNLYGGTYNLIVNNLSARGIEYTIVDINNRTELENAIRKETKIIYGETLGNPKSDVTDLDMIAEVAHSHGILFMVDNTFATPWLVRPIEHGADVVIHSATKFIGGHGAGLGGVIVDGGKFDFKKNRERFPTIGMPDPNYHGSVFADISADSPFATRARAVVLRDEGAAISPFNAFLMLIGLETLSLRVDRHVSNALRIVEYLNGHPMVESVSHPSVKNHPANRLYRKYFPKGGGSIFTFEIKGGQKSAWKFIDSLKIFSLLANVADAKSLVIHPASTTHSQMNEEELADAGITPSTIRLSIGIENVDDLIADIESAFKAVESSL